MQFLLIALAINIPCAVISAQVGSQKGEAVLGFIAGGLFNVFGLIFMIFSRGNRTPCPHCRSYIHPEATACPACGRDVHARVAREKMRHEQ